MYKGKGTKVIECMRLRGCLILFGGVQNEKVEKIPRGWGTKNLRWRKDEEGWTFGAFMVSTS